MSTVLVCDDAPQARETIGQVVAAVPGVTRVTVAASGEEVLARWPAERPDLLLLDLRMPGLDGLETCRRLMALHPEAAIVVLTMAEDPEGVARAVAAGAVGYLAKDASREEMSAVVALALPDGRAQAAGSSLAGAPGAGEAPAVAVPVPLTDRERQVLEGMSRGRSNAQIGSELFLSEDTIKTHARRLFRKLGAADRAHAVAEGFRHRILQ